MGADAVSASEANSDKQPSRICCVCAAPLPDKAIYCRECSNYQSPMRRWVSGINISELTALVSSGALALAFLNVHILNRSAEVGFTPLVCTDGKFDVAILNEGLRPSVLEKAFATRTVDGVPDGRVVELEPIGSIDRIFQMGKGRTLSFAPKDIGFPARPSTTKLCYSIELRTTEFNGRSQSGVKPCPCA